MNQVEVPSTGDLLADRYRLDEPVNIDADGRQVWRGLDVLLNRTVAVVINTPGGPEASPMMEAAVVTSRIGHASLVDVYDAVDETRFAYVVREWVEGQSLREILAHSPLGAQPARDIMASVAGAVAATHAQGISHSNIHPGTILFSEDDRVMVTEPRADTQCSQTDDVKALGATLYCCLTGLWPATVRGSEGLDAAEVSPVTGAIPDPTELAPGVSPALNSFVMGLLADEPHPAAASEVAAELRKTTDSTTVTPAVEEPPVEESDTPLAAVSTMGPPPPKPQEEAPAGMRRLALVVAAVAGLALVGVLSSAIILQGDDPDTDTAGLIGDEDDESETEGDDEGNSSGPEEIELMADQIRIVDPPDSNRSELEGTDLLVDNDSSTGWSTQTYYNHSNFGNLKPGMGILIDLGEEKEIASLRLHMTDPGATVTLRAGDSDPGSSSDGDQEIADSFQDITETVDDIDINHEFQPEDSPTTQYLKVWITELPPVSGGYKLTVSDISVYVR